MGTIATFPTRAANRHIGSALLAATTGVINKAIAAFRQSSAPLPLDERLVRDIGALPGDDIGGARDPLAERGLNARQIADRMQVACHRRCAAE